MAISNLQETLLMYAKQKSMLTNKISDVQFNILAASRKVLQKQAEVNAQQMEYYYYYTQEGMEDFEDEYNELCEQLQKEYEFDLANIKSYEVQLEIDKENYETRAQAITQAENSFKALIKTNMKQDFTYGGAQGQ